MASKVQICNEALQNIGASYITSIEEDTTNAIECNLRYDSARRALLEMHPWNFAIKRAALNANVTGPAFNYGYAFNLPSDFLYLYMTGTEERYQSPAIATYSEMTTVSNLPYYASVDKYRVEGNTLISESAEANIIYVADIEDSAQFSATFTQLLARYLGALIAYKIVGSNSERTAQMEIFKMELAEYQSIDSQQGVMDVLQVSEYLAAGV